MIRTILERLVRGKTLKRRLPKEFGSTPIYVAPDSQLKYLKLGKNAFDFELLEVAQRHIHKASSVWDIGANIGVFTFAAASIATDGAVLAVEADIWLAQVVKKSASLKANQRLSVQVLPTAISDDNGVATFLIAKRGRASNSLESVNGRSQMGGVRDKVMVPTLTLDTLLDFFSHPTFVKVDVEGAEVQVLQGAHRLLQEVRPLFYIEVGSDVVDEVSSLFIQNNYLLFDGQTQAPLSKCSFNTVAIPKEKATTS